MYVAALSVHHTYVINETKSKEDCLLTDMKMWRSYLSQSVLLINYFEIFSNFRLTNREHTVYRNISDEYLAGPAIKMSKIMIPRHYYY